MGQDENVGVLRGMRSAADQLVRGGKRETALAKPRDPGEQPGVVHPLATERCAPSLPRLVMADQHRGAIEAMTQPWTSSTLPPPSIRAKRSGSCAANARKAVFTAA